MMTNERILQVYMLGFNDELNGRKSIQSESILIKAYNIGRADAIAGDECEAVDNKTNTEILEQIKNL